MDWIKFILDFILHLDKHLGALISYCGMWTYLILFTIVFCETGLVVTPFLPGDSLLFAVGAFCAPNSAGVAGPLNLWYSLIILFIAAVIGDAVNFHIGAYIGPKALKNEKSRIFKKEYLDKTHMFYEKYGGFTIIIARFVPIVRTFAPFLAGVGKMNYSKFLSYNIIGAILWVFLLVFAGYFFGNLPFVQNNFSLVIIMIIIISVLPPFVEIIKQRRINKKAKKSVE